MTERTVVIGGGPAGCAVARRLAVAGVPVTLLTTGTVAGVEGLSRRTVEALANEGFGRVVAELHGGVPRTGEWGVGRRVEGTEWPVERTQLAATMREVARDAGVTVRDAAVVAIEGTAPSFRVLTRDAGEFTAACIVDARGRRGPELRGPKLLAVGQRFRAARARGLGTEIHPVPWGWSWIVTAGHYLWVQVAGRPDEARPDEWFQRAAAESAALRVALEGAEAVSTPVARPAHARRALAPTQWGWIRTGDAAVGRDPLSGQGVYEALRGAPAASAAAQSLLEGADPELVHRFLAERDDALWERVVAVAADFYEENASRGTFWAAAGAEYRALARPPSSRALAIERRPVLDGDRIRERDVVVTTAQPRGVWQVDGVPVVDLIHYIERAGHATPGDAAVALARAPAAVMAAARWLRDVGGWPARATHAFSAGG